jgi:dihydrofolate synthase/folylpolyglutamate synthase
MMTYRETLEFLSALNPQGIRLELEAIRSLLKRLKDPQNDIPAVLIAGTNGKGSVAAMTASILSRAGFRTGLYTSPDLIDLRERIRVDGQMIGRTEMAACAAKVRRQIREEVSYFEFLTAMAFLHFRQSRVDISVLEVGLGGRLDATNVVVPLVSVVTNISLEHRQYLGNTLKEIAREKGGIIKEGGICLTAARQEPVLSTLGAICRERGARLLRVGREIRTTRHPDGTFSWRGVAERYERLSTSLAGRHQIANAALALAVIEQIRAKGFGVDRSAVVEGLKEARWEGRLEILRRSPMLLVDGAHNPAGVATLCRALQEDFPHRRLILVFGVLSDKDYRRMARRLFPLADRVILTRPNSERAVSPRELLESVREIAPNAVVIDDPAAALEEALSMALAGDLVCAAGSLYLVGEIKKLCQTVKAGGS